MNDEEWVLQGGHRHGGAVGRVAGSRATGPTSNWIVDFGIGWDNSISGNINSSAIGTLNGQTAVILKNKYEDVYGTGLHLRFGGGYMLNEDPRSG